MSKIKNTKIPSIRDISISQEVSSSYLSYAMSVVVSRAIPDIRDGLKPVQRRILVSMYENDFSYNKPHKKSSRIVGDVMAQYHPHGDSSIYDAMVRMARDFTSSAKMIDGQGNFGSIDNDPPAAMRYTEARLSELAGKFMLSDINKDTVDKVFNYDKSRKEPIVLPATFPNVLVNASNGIAVGMASGIPSHNLHEIINGCCAYIDNDNITIDEIMEYIKGPDFPTGGYIVNVNNSLRDVYINGCGSIKMRPKYEIITDKKGMQCIKIYEIPYQSNKASIIENIANLVKDKKVEGISNIRDESDRKGICISIDIKNHYMPEAILSNLISKTNLGSSFNVNMLVINNNKPEVLGLLGIIKSFVDFRCDVVRRRTLYYIRENVNKAIRLIALVLIARDTERIVNVINSSDNYTNAKEGLMKLKWDISNIPEVELIIPDKGSHKSYTFTEKQAKTILDLKLYKLTKIEVNSMVNEFNALMPKIKELISIVNNKDKMLLLVRDELIKVRDNTKSPRRSQIVTYEPNSKAEEIVESQTIMITITDMGYIKSIPSGEYSTQTRGGKGRSISSKSLNEKDHVKMMISCNSFDDLLCISSYGKAYKIPVHKIHTIKSNSRSKGVTLNHVLNLNNDDERIVNCMCMTKEQIDNESCTIIFATSDGHVRRNSINAFAKIKSSGKIVMKLSEGQSLIACSISERSDDEVMLVSKAGKCVRMDINQLRIHSGRSSSGVTAIKISDNDIVVAAEILNDKNKGGYLFSMTDDGLAKMTPIKQYRKTNRNTSGVKTHNLARNASENASIVSCFIASEEVFSTHQIGVITDKHRVLKCNIDEVPIHSRGTVGVKMIKFDSKYGKEKVVSAKLMFNDGDSE